MALLVAAKSEATHRHGCTCRSILLGSLLASRDILLRSFLPISFGWCQDIMYDKDKTRCMIHTHHMIQRQDMT